MFHVPTAVSPGNMSNPTLAISKVPFKVLIRRMQHLFHYFTDVISRVHRPIDQVWIVCHRLLPPYQQAQYSFLAPSLPEPIHESDKANPQQHAATDKP